MRDLHKFGHNPPDFSERSDLLVSVVHKQDLSSLIWKHGHYLGSVEHVVIPEFDDAWEAHFGTVLYELGAGQTSIQPVQLL